jgi:uncharacterized membrane protein
MDALPFDVGGFVMATMAVAIILPLVITGLVIGLIVWAIRRNAPASEDPAITELKSRLARGEIDPSEYQARLDALKADD